MPCGGGDIGMNVWVEEGDVLFYLSRSGTFDENNCLLKQGRFRIRLSPNPFKETKEFRQELMLNDGFVEISAEGTRIQIWADVFHPVVHVEIVNARPCRQKSFMRIGDTGTGRSGKERGNNAPTNGLLPREQ